jgi:hypothetical protein
MVSGLVAPVSCARPTTTQVGGDQPPGTRSPGTQPAGDSPAPTLAEVRVDPPQVNFFARPGEDPPPENIAVAVDSGGPDWTATASTDWLRVSPQNSSSSGGPQTVSLSAAAAGLPEGRHDAVISLRGAGMKDREVPVRLYVTNTRHGDAIDAAVEVAGAEWEDRGIRLDTDVAVTVSSLDSPLPDGTLRDFAPQSFDAGDLTVLVTGTLTNESDRDWEIGFRMEGLDAEGNQVAIGLDRSLGVPIMGYIRTSVYRQSSRPFSYHLSFAGDIKVIRVTGQAILEIGAPFPEATPLPESEIAHVRFSEQWLQDNDTAPGPDSVRITFPRAWLQDAPPIAGGEKVVELVVPYKLLEDHNESEDPDEITVLFPVRYFDGLGGP